MTSLEYCPACRGPRTMTVTSIRREVEEPGGATRTVDSRTYRCESCGTTVRSEDVAPGPNA